MSNLRSEFAPGTTRWAVRRAQWAALGHKPEDYEGKPLIAVVNTSSKLSICFSHLDEVAEEVSEAIWQAGGVPFEIRTTAPSDFVTSAGRKARYILPSRDLIVNDIESAVEGAQLDGMVCLSSCDKTTPAHLMASARLDIPSLLVIGGYQEAGSYNGCSVDIDDVYESVGKVVSASMSSDELGCMANCAIRGPGVCAGFGTANTMHCLAEGLGMTLPGAAPNRANSEKMHKRARESGRRIVEMVEEDLRPRTILSREAFGNAIELALALGGSVNCVRHLTAVANEAELDIDVLQEFESRAKSASLAVRIRPNGPTTVPEFDDAGGVRRALVAIEPRLDRSAMTVSGKTVGQLIDTTERTRNDVIHDLPDSAADEAGLVILRGSLAPDGSIVKSAGYGDSNRCFEGRAKVFDNEDSAIQALGEGEIRAGDVVVLRGMGPRGGPGTVFAASFAAALNGADLGGDVAIVTDGELSGLNHGIIVGQVMPEAADGGPLAGVEDGDSIEIDMDERLINCTPVRDGSPMVSGDYRQEHGWLGQYQALVGPIQGGAVLRRP